MKPQILLIDDDPGTRFGFSKYLLKKRFVISEASCLAEAREATSSRRFDAILLDIYLPDGSGLDWILEIKEAYPDIPLIVITGMGDIPVAVEAMRRWADNFLTKPVDMASLDVFLQKTLELGNMRRRHLIEQRLAKKEEIYFGESPEMKKVKELASLSAEKDSALLIMGETGTGKGMLAKWIHENSKRNSYPFVEINCSALRGELLASELFGNIRGAFTTAVQDRQGLIEIADRGTLLLDEIGDMDIGVQSQFLKVIEGKSFRRIGDVKMRKSDFRLISATNKDLQNEIQQGRFRNELYFRIHVFPIFIPPLRERPEDIPGLVRHILEIIGASVTEISPEGMQFLKAYPWPGNIRELRNILERALLLSQGKPLTPEHFPGLESATFAQDYLYSTLSIHKKEELNVMSVLKSFDGDINKTAEALGISRATLYRKLKKIKENR